MSVESVDVLVIGGGMVGLTAALAMAEKGFTVRVLEARQFDTKTLYKNLEQRLSQAAAKDSEYDPRVSALTGASEQLLKNLEVWPLMRKLRLSPYTEMDVWDGEGSGQIHFSAHDIYEDSLGHIIENSVTLAALYSRVTQHPDIRVEVGVSVHQLSDASNVSGVMSRKVECVDGQIYEARLVVAADGAHSRIRQLAAIPMCEWDYGHHAITTTVRTEKEHQSTAWQCFTQTGPIAFLPLPDPHLCSLVWSTSPDQASQLESLSTEDFCYQLEQAFERKLGAVQWCDDRFSFPLRQRHAHYYVKPSLAVIGDAAHTIHPLAGQGVNLGLMDAAFLAQVLNEAKARGEDFASESVLKRYQRNRQPINIEMSAAMEGFKRLFEADMPLLRLARGVGMSLMNKSGPIKQHIVMQAMGLNDGRLPDIAKRNA